jgi:ectoine hydroxylase-related dioxygenase (phytanoyl-CoA dioxygenase family)
MLTVEQRREFDERGWVRVSGAFSRGEAVAMEDVLWTTLGKMHGLSRDDPSTWSVQHAYGLQELRRNKAFHAIGSSVTREAITELLAPMTLNEPKHWGQFLVSFPAEEPEWNVPTRIWHTDFAFQAPRDRPFGLLLFSFLSDTPARAGGTVIVAGSHRVVRQFVEAQPAEKLSKMKMKKVRHALFESEPWLYALATDRDAPDRIERFMARGETLGDVPVRVEELTGEAGDIVLAQPWLLHCSAPNCSDQPRMMCVQRIHTA